MPKRPHRLAAAGLLALLAAVGFFLLGRVTAGGSAGRTTGPGRGYYDGYFAGLRAGEAQGREEGRAAQEVASLPKSARAQVSRAYRDGYTAGLDDAFTGYDGGWSTGVPYVVVLEAGGATATYRIAAREELRPGVDYYRCAARPGFCTRPGR